MADPVANLDEIRALLSQLPGPDLAAGTAAAARQAQLTKPAGSLGRLEELAIWLATWQARHPPRLDQPRTSGVRRQSRGRRARRFGLSRRGHGADGAELHRRRRRGKPAVPRVRRRSEGLRDEPRQADRRHRRRAGDERGGMRQGDGLRHDGGGARHRRAGARRDGDRQYHCRGSFVRRSVRRRGGVVDRPRNRGRRCRARGKTRGRGASRRAPSPGGRAIRSTCCAGWAGSNSPPSPER